MELGLHIADFTRTGGAPALGPALARHARNAEAAGITRITVMDHFWQNRGVGPPEHEMLAAYTTQPELAQHGPTRITQAWSQPMPRPRVAAITGQGVNRVKTPSLDHSLSIRIKGSKWSGRVLPRVGYASVPPARHRKSVSARSEAHHKRCACCG